MVGKVVGESQTVGTQRDEPLIATPARAASATSPGNAAQPPSRRFNAFLTHHTGHAWTMPILPIGSVDQTPAA
jgi:hypothetical protein